MRGRPRSFDREAALDRAIRLFWRKGYEATSVRDLSADLGIGAPSLYNTFGDKQTLFTEAVDVYDRVYGGFIEAAIREEPTASRAMRRILTEAPARYTRHGMPNGCLVASGDSGTEDEAIRAVLRQRRDDKTSMLREKIDADIVAGCLPAGTDANGLASYVMTVLRGMDQRARDNATRRDLAGIARIASRVLP